MWPGLSVFAKARSSRIAPTTKASHSRTFKPPPSLPDRKSKATQHRANAASRHDPNEKSKLVPLRAFAKRSDPATRRCDDFDSSVSTGIFEPIRRNWIRGKVIQRRSLIPSSARPLPLSSLFNQAASNGVQVNVIDHFQQCLTANHVAIMLPSRLPEMVLKGSPMFSPNLGQPFRSFRFEESNSSPPNGSLDSFQKTGCFVLTLAWVNDQMDMFGHENVGPKCIVQFLATGDQFRCEPFARSILRKQLNATKARKRQLMCVPRVVVTLGSDKSLSVVHHRSPLRRSHSPAKG